MAIPHLPADILKDVCAVIQPNSFVSVYTLQQLRLVNRSWSGFATDVLFRDYDNFSLGNCHEDVQTRVSTLAKSHLRFRVKGLTISRYVLVPRAIKQGGSISGRGDRESSGILEHMVVGLRHQLDRLQGILGPEFRFQSLTAGTPALRDFPMYEILSGGSTSPFDNTLVRFAKLLTEITQLDAFSCVSEFGGTFSPHDLQALRGHFMEPWDFAMAVDGVSEVENLFNPALLPFLGRLQVLDIFFPKKSRDERGFASMALAEIIDRCTTLRVLKFRFTKRDRFGLLFPTISDVEDQPLSPSVEELSITDCALDWIPNLFLSASRFPNLKTLRLLGVHVIEHPNEFLEDDMDFIWGDIFRRLPEACLNLTSIFFELLDYKDPGDLSIEKSAFKRDIYDPTCRKFYKRPILTFYESDIEFFNDLRSKIEERREERGLERDPWLSDFCAREDVVDLLC